MEALVKKINHQQLFFKKVNLMIRPFELLKTEHDMEIMTIKTFKKRFGAIDEYDLIEKLADNSVTYSSNGNLNYENPVAQIDEEYIEYYYEQLKRKRRYKMLLMVYIGEDEYASGGEMLEKESWAKQRWLRKKINIQNKYNRIFGFVIMNEKPSLCKLKKTHPYGNMMSIPIICGSPFSKLTKKRGMGAYLMLFCIMYAKEKKKTKIILEVTNHEATIPISEPNVIDNEVDDDDETDDFFWKILSTRKRMNRWDYMGELDDDADEEEWDDIPLEDRMYGGRLYQKGKEATAGLYNLYERWGFVENPLLNTVYKCFDISPLPSMEICIEKNTMDILYRSIIVGENIFPQSKFV